MSRPSIRRSAAGWAVLVLAAAPLAARASTALSLDGAWRFRTDPASLQPGYDPAARVADEGFWSAARPVDVPHTWAIGPDHGVNGAGWYRRGFVLPAGLAGRHAELRFDAAFANSRVWVNGREVGGHAGGFTAFSLDVTSAVHAGENEVEVALDDRPGFATVPGYAMRLRASGSVAYDWQANGGLVRDVTLNIADGDALIRRQTLRQNLDADFTAAGVEDHVLVENVGEAPRTLSVDVEAHGPDGALAARGRAEVRLGAHAAGEAVVRLRIAHPRLWNVGAAQLYEVQATLAEAGPAIDQRRDPLGLRTIAIRDRRLYVNGAPVRLSGVTRHEDSPWEGLAETRGTIVKDWDDLAALHTTLTRPVHYPQPQAVLDQADRDGVLLIPEIPVWQMNAAQLADPRLIAAAKTMMREMIEQDADHPSVMAWSVCNESDASTPAGQAYVRAMKAMINALDPGRLVSFADADVAIAPYRDEPVMRDVDFIMANAYFGTWSGAASGVEPWLDFLDRTYPDKMVVISEFGWPGPFSADSATADRDRAQNLLGQLKAFDARPFVGGAIFWTYQDYRSSRNLWAGQVDGYVDHGLVDENRQRRASYFAWEARNRALATTADWRVGAGGPEGFSALVTPAKAGSLPSYPLIGYRARWRVTDAKGALLDAGEQALDLARPAALTRSWAGRTGGEGARLTLDILDEAGVRADGLSLDYRPLRLGAQPFAPDPKQLPPPSETP